MSQDHGLWVRQEDQSWRKGEGAVWELLVYGARDDPEQRVLILLRYLRVGDTALLAVGWEHPFPRSRQGEHQGGHSVIDPIPQGLEPTGHRLNQ